MKFQLIFHQKLKISLNFTTTIILNVLLMTVYSHGVVLTPFLASFMAALLNSNKGINECWVDSSRRLNMPPSGNLKFPDPDVDSAREVAVLVACALVSNPDDVQLQPESPHVRQQFFINKRSTSERELSASNIVHKCTQHRKLQLNSFHKIEIARTTKK